MGHAWARAASQGVDMRFLRMAVVPAGLAMLAAAHAATSQEAAFLAENQAAMDKMTAGMDIKPTGDVDHDFIAMMIPHHQGAIDMARAELLHGHNPCEHRPKRQRRFWAAAPACCKAVSQVFLITPRLWARETAWLRFSTESLPKIFLTWDFTVSGVIPRSRAISLLDLPSPIRSTISRSRGLTAPTVPASAQPETVRANPRAAC